MKSFCAGVLFLPFMVSFASIAESDALPTPIPNAQGMASIECSNNDEDCLRKTNGGLLLPYFGTETKVIFTNYGSRDVDVNLMVGTNPNTLMTTENKTIVDDRFAWFVLVTDRVNDHGRFVVKPNGTSHQLSVDVELPKIVMERLTAGANSGLSVPTAGNNVVSIFPLWETIWTTLRVSVPKGYSVWMVPVRMKSNSGYKVGKGDPLNGRTRQEECSDPGEIGSMWTCSDDKYHFRYWLQSVDVSDP